jgi:hypothetical protein
LSSKRGQLAYQYSNCGRGSQPWALASEPGAHEGVPIGPYVPQFLRSSVGPMEITRKPAVTSSSIFVLLGVPSTQDVHSPHIYTLQLPALVHHVWTSV